MTPKNVLPSVLLTRAVELFERGFSRFLTANGHQAIPRGLRYYVVGDIHGCAGLLKQIQKQILKDQVDHPVDQAIEIYLGDYIDRGPSSREVIENLATLPNDGRQRIFLMGNHESLLRDFLADARALRNWTQVGGIQTLQSYGITMQSCEDDAIKIQSSLRDAMPLHHLDFLRTLKAIHVAHGHAFVHAGVRPGVPLDRQSEQDCLWIREEFLDYTGSLGARVVHGHTPCDGVDVRPNRINIDTGAYMTGNLSCLIHEEDNLRLLQTKKISPPPLLT